MASGTWTVKFFEAQESQWRLELRLAALGACYRREKSGSVEEGMKTLRSLWRITWRHESQRKTQWRSFELEQKNNSLFPEPKRLNGDCLILFPLPWGPVQAHRAIPCSKGHEQGAASFREVFWRGKNLLEAMSQHEWTSTFCLKDKDKTVFFVGSLV